MGGAASRRAVLAGAVLAPWLAGCGFRPMYARAPEGSAGPAAAGLSAINVGLIPERSGQLLREALQERFERSGMAVARLYDLQVSFAIAREGIGIQPDNSVTRLRLTGTATYTLMAEDAGRTTLTSGTVRKIDGLNVVDEQYFASDLESEQAQRRLAEAVADEIALRLAAFFNRRAAAAPAG
jgi:LPS-assembly lipoprotein